MPCRWSAIYAGRGTRWGASACGALWLAWVTRPVAEELDGKVVTWMEKVTDAKGLGE